MTLNQLKSVSLEISKVIKEVKQQLDESFRYEEVYWRQRSKALWLHEDDRKARYFHAKASERRKRNLIDRLLDVNNCWKEDIKNVENEIYNYFTTLLTSSH